MGVGDACLKFEEFFETPASHYGPEPTKPLKALDGRLHRRPKYTLAGPIRSRAFPAETPAFGGHDQI